MQANKRSEELLPSESSSLQEQFKNLRIILFFFSIEMLLDLLLSFLLVFLFSGNDWFVSNQGLNRSSS